MTDTLWTEMIMSEMRLQKYIAYCGVASRRKAEELIAAGRITLNGSAVRKMGVLVKDGDEVRYNGKLISPEVKKHYILFNKPEGVITSASDEFGRETVLDFFDGINERIYPVGRLDYDTSGLLILTNDGKFANFMTHPSNHIGKTYLVACSGMPDERGLNKLRNGVEIDDFLTHKAKVSAYRGKGKWTLSITIYEGRNRQVRRMIEAVGLKVLALKRIAIGGVHDKKLAEGKWRSLTSGELKDLGYEAD